MKIQCRTGSNLVNIFPESVRFGAVFQNLPFVMPFQKCNQSIPAGGFKHKPGRTTTMKRESIALHLRSFTYTGVANFAQSIHDNLATSTVYTSPVPSLTVQQAAITALQDAVIKWGSRSMHGTTEDWSLLQAAYEEVCRNLRTVAGYCMTVTPNSPLDWQNVGFISKRQGHKLGFFNDVRDLKQVTNGNVQKNCIKLKWKKPDNVPASARISYEVLRSEDMDIANAKVVGTVTKTSFVDNLDGLAHVQYYWVAPVNAHGRGIMSQAVAAGVLRLY